MRLILSPKDSTCKMTLTDVEAYAQEGNTLLVRFRDGVTRNYPFQHLWYYESSPPVSSRTIINGNNGDTIE